jgi:hypothetical protein
MGPTCCPGTSVTNQTTMDSEQTTDTTERSRTHVFKSHNTTNTTCEENCKPARVQVSSQTKTYKNINVLF